MNAVESYEEAYWKLKDKDNINIFYILIGLIFVVISVFFILQNKNLLINPDWKPWEYDKYVFFNNSR